MRSYHVRFFFFFQAEDGIRDLIVTGVQTCALPIFAAAATALALVLFMLPVLPRIVPAEPFSWWSSDRSERTRCGEGFGALRLGFGSDVIDATRAPWSALARGVLEAGGDEGGAEFAGGAEAGARVRGVDGRLPHGRGGGGGGGGGPHAGHRPQGPPRVPPPAPRRGAPPPP